MKINCTFANVNVSNLFLLITTVNTTHKCLKCDSDVPVGKLICNSCFQKSIDDTNQTIKLLEQHESLCSYYAEVRDDIQKDLTRSLSRKKRAEVMKKRQNRLVVEWIVLVVVLIILNIGVLFVMMMNSYSGFVAVGSLLASLFLMIILKFTRFNSLDMNLRTIPQLAYQIDQLDVPDNYIEHLRNQLDKLTRIVEKKVCT